jgi:HK97 family phage prohead protease
MLTAPALGGLEVRAEDDGSVRVSGRFPYGQAAQLAPGRSEVFAPGSLEPRQNTYLLSQHEFARPLASTGAGTLELRQESDALAFEARLSPEVAGTSHGRDAVALIRSGLAVGLSPGFRVPPGGERVERRGDGLQRTVTRAELHELSIVTKPAFEAAQVEARSWSATERPWRPWHPAARWR